MPFRHKIAQEIHGNNTRVGIMFLAEDKLFFTRLFLHECN